MGFHHLSSEFKGFGKAIAHPKQRSGRFFSAVKFSSLPLTSLQMIKKGTNGRSPPETLKTVSCYPNSETEPWEIVAALTSSTRFRGCRVGLADASISPDGRLGKLTEDVTSPTSFQPSEFEIKLSYYNCLVILTYSHQRDIVLRSLPKIASNVAVSQISQLAIAPPTNLEPLCFETSTDLIH